MADQINAVLAQRTAAGGGKYTDFAAASELGVANVFGPATFDQPGIQAAMALANIWGGGTVPLPSGRILLAASLVLLSGVHLCGVAPQLVYNTIPDSGLTTLVGSQGGTVLVPTGAFPAITANTASLAAPASQTAFSQGGLTSLSVENVGFSGDSGGTWAILAGGTNNPSCWYSQFKNIYATGFTAGGGFSWTNYQHCQFTGNYTFGCAWGQFHGIDVAASFLAPGNSTYYDLYNCNPTGSGIAAILARNITFLTTATTGGAANNNEFKFDRIQSNRFGGTTTTQAATMVNTQANITITDGTKFAVGLPVTVDATQNGFTLKQCYFVISVVGNVIQLSNTYGGAAVTATAANAVNIVHQGFPCFEMIALSGSSNTNVVIDNLDVEGLSTCAAFFQNVNGVDLTFSQVPGIGQATQSLCTRGCNNVSYRAPQSISTDIDQNSSGNGRAVFFYGARFGTSVGHMGHGIWYDSVSGKSVLSLANQFNTASGGDLTWDPATNNGFLAPRFAGIGENGQIVNGSVAIGSLNLSYTNIGAAAAMTIPTVNAANKGAWLQFYNPTAGTQTIATDGTQLFNGIAGRTVITLNANASVRLSGMQTTAGAVFTWNIVGGSSQCVAGVISAPS